MSGNIFSSGKAGSDEYSKKFDSQGSSIMGLLQQQKELESSMDLIKEQVELLDHNSVKNSKQSLLEIKSLKEEVNSLAMDLSKIKEQNSKIIRQLKLTANKDDVVKLEKYIDLWNPMDFVTRKELEDERKKIISQLKEILLTMM